MDFKRTITSPARMLALALGLVLVLGLCLSLVIGSGVAQAQRRAAVFSQPVAAGAAPSAAGVAGAVCDVSALPPFNTTGPWFFSLCRGEPAAQQDGQPAAQQDQGIRQTCFFTTTAAARLHLSPPMLRRALLRALEGVAMSDAAAPASVGVFSMQCLRGEQPPAG